VTGRVRGSRGQSAVELALALPLALLFLLLIIQVGLLVHTQVLTTHAAREAARAAAVDPGVEAARRGALDGAPLEGDRLDVELSGDLETGGRATAMVDYRAPTDVPLVGPLVPDFTLHAEATMRVE
jgi:Flp pilus assembly protein TadG